MAIPPPPSWPPQAQRLWRSLRSRPPSHCLDASDDRLDRDRFPFLDDDLHEDPSVGCGDLGVDFVCRDLEDGFVALYLVADFLEPLRECAFSDGFAHLRHDYIYACHL